MTGVRVLLFCLIGALALRPASVSADEVRILVPVFAGDERLGRTVANLLRLQVSQTFQVAGTGTTGVMILRERPLRESDHGVAQDAAMELGALCHLVLWGQAYSYSDGVAVETHLSTTPWLTDRKRRPEVWEIRVPGTDIALASDLPREVYEFPTRVLSLDAARHYADFNGLQIYRDRAFTQPIGRFRDMYTAHKYWPEAAEISSGGVRGFVPLPYLGEAPRQTIDFVAGYIRILRGDWPGAAERFRATYAMADATPEVAIDTRLFLGLIEEKRGRSGLRYFAEAMELNPYDRGAASYLLLGRLAAALRASGPVRASARAALVGDLARLRSLFPENNPWLRELDRAVERVPME